MVNKLATSVGRYAVKKIANKFLDKAVERISKPYERLKREVFGIKPLNVGEKELIQCLQNKKNSSNYCKSVGEKVRKVYHKTGKY